MKVFVCSLLMMCSLAAKAEEPLLIPRHTPNPVYPDALQKAGIAGKVRVDFIVQSDGSVKDVSIRESSNAALAESVKQTLALWRFKPWTLAESTKPEIRIEVPFVFSSGGTVVVPSDINVLLPKMTCRDVNKSFDEWNRIYREHSLSRMRIFWHTDGYLDNRLMTNNATVKEIEALRAKLRSNLSSIISNCRSNPDALYMDYLPEEIRRLL